MGFRVSEKEEKKKGVPVGKENKKTIEQKEEDRMGYLIVPHKVDFMSLEVTKIFLRFC